MEDLRQEALRLSAFLREHRHLYNQYSRTFWRNASISIDRSITRTAVVADSRRAGSISRRDSGIECLLNGINHCSISWTRTRSICCQPRTPRYPRSRARSRPPRVARRSRCMTVLLQDARETPRVAAAVPQADTRARGRAQSRSVTFVSSRCRTNVAPDEGHEAQEDPRGRADGRLGRSSVPTIERRLCVGHWSWFSMTRVRYATRCERGGAMIAELG